MSDKVMVVQDLKPGQAYTIVGDKGGRIQVTGEIYPSAVLHGCHAIETEVGTLYIESFLEILVEET